MTTRQRAGGRKATEARVRRAERKARGLEELLADAVATQARQLQRGLEQSAALVAAGGDQPTPPLGNFLANWWDDLLWTAATSEAETFMAAFIVDELDRGWGLTVATQQPFVQGLAAEAVADIDAWALELRQQVAQIIDNGHRDSLSVRQVADQLTEKADINLGRAKSIARSEMVGASNAASHQGYTAIAEPGDELEWLATDDGRTRDSHRRLDGDKIPVGERFNVGGHLADHPGDRSLPPEERIACRCSVIFLPGGQ